MFVPSERPHWLVLVFQYRGSALSRIRWRLLSVFVVAVALTALELLNGKWHVSLTPVPFSLVGIALGIFLGFRNNTSYDRFWEGRKLWGRLVNTTRSITRQALTLVDVHDASRDASSSEADPVVRQQVYRVVAYVHALRMHLRGQVDVDSLSPGLSNEDQHAVRHHLNVPSAILLLIGKTYRRLAREGRVTDFAQIQLERSLTDLTDIQGGCERIKSTPIPHNYTILIHRIVAVYVFALPFGLIDTLGKLTPLVVLMVAYTFLGLDAVGDELEDPFGLDLNDLPLDTISRMIEINLRQALGETDVPAPLQPIRGVLS
jgi:putative membrane protein